jgi:hypothetical protein
MFLSNDEETDSPLSLLNHLPNPKIKINRMNKQLFEIRLNIHYFGY